MKSVTVNNNDAGQRLDKFLFKYLKNVPQSLLYRYIRTKRIKVNSKRSEISYKLKPGDVIDLYINDELFSEAHTKSHDLSMKVSLDIVYEDQNILLINKRSGVIVHESDADNNSTLIEQITAYLYQKGEYDPEKENSFAPALCNRLDRNTSGIVICAKNAASLRIMNDLIKRRRIEKYYLCIAVGTFQKKSAVLTAYHKKNSDTNTVEILSSACAGAKKIVTAYRVIKERDDLSLLEVHLITGRTHQIRAHLAHMGHPLLGDGKYGSNRINKSYGKRTQQLCAYKLIFHIDGEENELGYLDDREFMIENVDFAKEFFNSKG